MQDQSGQNHRGPSASYSTTKRARRVPSLSQKKRGSIRDEMKQNTQKTPPNIKPTLTGETLPNIKTKTQGSHLGRLAEKIKFRSAPTNMELMGAVHPISARRRFPAPFPIFSLNPLSEVEKPAALLKFLPPP